MKKTYAEISREREKRISEAIQLKIPDRVPMELSFGYFPARYAGITCEAPYYDYEAWLAACKKTLTDFGEDVSRVQPFFPGKVLELLDEKPLAWPGHGCSPMHSHQYIEGEFMKPDEYEVLLNDPTDFMLRRYLPRIAGCLESLSRLPEYTAAGFSYHNAVSLADAFSSPEIASAVKKLIQAGEELRKWRPQIEKFAQELKDLGFPAYTSAYALAPFDEVSDHLRGMKGTMLDMYRQPDKLLEACDTILKRKVSRLKPAATDGVNRVGIPLHRGSEGFMSIKQFEKFYWPTLKGYILALVERGYIPCVAFEGDYTSRLEYLLELPKAKVLAHFDTTDLFKAKDVLRGHLCISGNVPVSLLQAGTPDDVREHCKKLIDYAGKEGGYIMSTRGPLDDAKKENIKALVDFTVKYGVYK
jgi:hypothetical protein